MSDYGTSDRGDTANHWSAAALCAQTDPSSFYVGKGESTHTAKSICNLCEVRTECLAWTMRLELGSGATDRFGVSGGLSTHERAKLDASGWLPGDATPDVKLRGTDAGDCPLCGVPCRSVSLHVASVHPGVRSAA